VGDTAVDLNSARQDAVRIEVAADVASAFFATLAQQQRSALGRTSLELAQSIRNTVARRIAVGRSAEAELATAEIGLARARFAVARAVSDLTVQRNKLAALMADEASSFGELRGDLFALPKLADARSLQMSLADNPQLKQLTTRQAALTAQRRLAQAQARTDMTVGASVRRLAQTDDTALVFSVNFPLGQKHRAAPGIDYARAQERSAPQATETRRLQLLADLHELSGDLGMTRLELGVLQTEIIPLAERAVELYEAGYARGRYGLFELNDAQRTLLVARQDAITAAERYQQLAIDIRSLLGEMPAEGAIP
jgi:cobalt-zinc-cadmium efflux system outer membrane protein